jgi:2-polyprenyl-3-methyl-5-hydroxy-6-metoxy-1,4-benzoquinol methylase
MKDILKRILFRKPVAKAMSHWLLQFDNVVTRLLNTFLIAAEGGRHPKYHIIKYYEFFADNIPRGSLVLDVGCGNGALSIDIADKTHSRVVGVEILESNVGTMRKTILGRKDIEVVRSDIREFEDPRAFDVVVLSNFLEHIDGRENLLSDLRRRFRPKKVLIRVPMYDRDWKVHLKMEKGIEWRLDPTHKIEYTEDTLDKELNRSGLKMITCEKRWGEIYAVAVPCGEGPNGR